MAETPSALWRVVAASVPGASHARAGQACQDSHCWRTLDGGAVIVAIGDGAGSAAHGGEGAKLAARVAVDYLAGLSLALTDDLSLKAHLDAALRAARAAVVSWASEAGHSPREYATTLILITILDGRVAAGQVGDGAVAIMEESGEMLPLTRPSADEYVNETTFLTSSEGVESAQIVVWTGAATRLAAFTDGLQQLALKMPAGVPHAPFFAPLFRFVSEMADPSAAADQLQSFLKSPRIMERVDDDLTLFLAAKVEE